MGRNVRGRIVRGRNEWSPSVSDWKKFNFALEIFKFLWILVHPTPKTLNLLFKSRKKYYSTSFFQIRKIIVFKSVLENKLKAFFLNTIISLFTWLNIELNIFSVLKFQRRNYMRFLNLDPSRQLMENTYHLILFKSFFYLGRYKIQKCK